MNQFNTVLLSLFIVQLILTIYMFSGADENAVYQDNEDYIGIQFNIIDQISITDADQKQLTLSKTNQQWQLTDYFDVAVNAAKVQRVIDDLSAIKTGWPVARTETAAPRFKVAEGQFEKRIDFNQQGKIVETLYLGSSPSFRKVHTRKSGDNTIYNIEFSTYELSTQNKDWMNKDLLKQDTANLTRVKVNDLELIHTGEQWQLEGLSSNQQTASDVANSLIDKLSNLTYTEIISTQEQPEFGLTTPNLLVQLGSKSGEVIQLSFAQSDDNNYIGHSSSLPYYFKISQYSLKPILDINRDQLIMVAESTPETETKPIPKLEIPESTQ